MNTMLKGCGVGIGVVGRDAMYRVFGGCVGVGLRLGGVRTFSSVAIRNGGPLVRWDSCSSTRGSAITTLNSTEFVRNYADFFEDEKPYTTENTEDKLPTSPEEIEALRKELRREVLRLYKEVLLLALDWHGPEEEQDYILDEARFFFRYNKGMTDIKEIQAAIKSAKDRIELAKHYRIPYERLHYFPPGANPEVFIRDMQVNAILGKLKKEHRKNRVILE